MIRFQTTRPTPDKPFTVMPRDILGVLWQDHPGHICSLYVYSAKGNLSISEVNTMHMYKYMMLIKTFVYFIWKKATNILY